MLAEDKWVKFVPMFIWYCKKCGHEYLFEINRLSHGPDGSSCLACRIKHGDRESFLGGCPNCKEKT